MKRVKKLLAVILCMTMLMGMTVTVNAAPAPAVTKVQITDKTVGSDGYVYVTVNVTGYGKAIYATHDNEQVFVSKTTTIGKPVVTGFVYIVKCLPKTAGNHKFMFRITSINSPWNTVTTSKYINF